jgi:two-component system, NarL family, nitrate/nitrite response regulator NarL
MGAQDACRAVKLELHARKGSKFPRPTVFIISDVRLYREGLSWNLTRDGSLDVMGSCGHSSIALESLKARAPEAIILDIAMRDGLQLARELHARLPQVKIVAFAVSDIDREILTGAMAGISGYVHRDGSVRDLVNEVLNAVRGELHCSPRLAARLLQQIASLSFGEADASKASGNGDARRALTRREAEILGLVDKGLSNKEIARALNISFATVKNHMHHILEKLHVRRRAQALARMRELGLGAILWWIDTRRPDFENTFNIALGVL